MDARQRDDLSLPPNDVMTREELQFEQDFAAWRERISPIFQAKLLACAAALVGDLGHDQIKEFYETTLYSAFCWLSEKQD